MRFLVVDDSSTMRRIIINTLNRIGYMDCTEASNGREGAERAASGGVDFVITDWHMSVMSGIEMVRQLRASDLTRSVPVVMVTTHASKDDIVEAMHAGVNGYMVKPFTPDTMKEKIDAVLQR